MEVTKVAELEDDEGAAPIKAPPIGQAALTAAR